MQRIISTMVGVALVAACSDQSGAQRDVQELSLTQAAQDVVGTPFEPVAKTQSQLGQIFDPNVTPGELPENLLSMARTFEEQKLKSFQSECRELVAYFQADTPHRVVLWSAFSRSWREVRSMIETRSRGDGWSAGQREVLERILEQFTCR